MSSAEFHTACFFFNISKQDATSLLQKSICIQCLLVQHDTNCIPRRNVYVMLNSIVCLTFYPACIAETKNERALR